MAQTLINCEKAQGFSRPLTRARKLAHAWWELQGKKGIWAGSNFNANAYRLQMLNRFPEKWRDRHKHDVGGEVTVKIIRFSDLADEGKTIDVKPEEPRITGVHVEVEEPDDGAAG